MAKYTFRKKKDFQLINEHHNKKAKHDVYIAPYLIITIITIIVK